MRAGRELGRNVRAVGAAAGVTLATGSAYAEEPPLFLPGDRTTSSLPGDMHASDTIPTDGVYGRFDGLFDLGLAAGVEQRDGTAGAALVTLHYLFMAGIYGAYTDGLGTNGLDSARTASLGVDVRPGFIPRWSAGMQDGPRALDLAIDSISIGMGAYFRQPDGKSFGDRKGFELSVGFGVPLAGTAEGPWLGARGLLRWDDPTGRSHETARAAALLTVGWHFAVGK
jgi:hypothetical protein